MALPLLPRGARVRVEVEGELISKPYVDITLNLMRRFGVAVERDGWRRSPCRRRAATLSPGTLHVEGDASSASYFLAGAARSAAARCGSTGVGPRQHPGRRRVSPTRSQQMGADVTLRRRLDRGARPAARSRRSTLDCNAIPDAAMTLAVVGAVRRRRRPRCATSAAGASRKPTASRRWRRELASWARRWRRAPTGCA